MEEFLFDARLLKDGGAGAPGEGGERRARAAAVLQTTGDRRLQTRIPGGAGAADDGGRGGRGPVPGAVRGNAGVAGVLRRGGGGHCGAEDRRDCNAVPGGKVHPLHWLHGPRGGRGGPPVLQGTAARQGADGPAAPHCRPPPLLQGVPRLQRRQPQVLRGMRHGPQGAPDGQVSPPQRRHAACQAV
eukprot:CAMPEP_0114614744 /NCGR_PEP_ID=MMETSP0168-20121206/5810_1 /TAXON_ID=95228 ORGANISM="Vannella sp., Strain DIVA3 517/6/12" /NCGR_SAMPLE_ID=MMETSP0168 /ASSEMBLY_ACC=CAM_ASM_000044 /LENGTH=185 /DNA_ID=CAMNT_0001825799 /DNA_START=155 /DNA_END=708 /DNA_ORIENTATION=-